MDHGKFIECISFKLVYMSFYRTRTTGVKNHERGPMPLLDFDIKASQQSTYPVQSLSPCSHIQSHLYRKWPPRLAIANICFLLPLSKLVVVEP